MKMITSRSAVALGAAAMLAMSASPAMARGWHRNHGRVDTGDVVAGVLIFGGIAAIAAAASQSSRERRQRETDYRYPDGSAPDPRYPDRDGRYGEPAPRYGEPTPRYGEPSPRYGEPSPRYGEPGPGYGNSAPPPYGNSSPPYGNPSPQYGEPSGRYGEGADGEPYSDGWRSGSMDGAVDICVAEVERSDRDVDTVDSVNREADGWRIDGRVEGGRDYSCTVDREGRIRRVTIDGRAIL